MMKKSRIILAILIVFILGFIIQNRIQYNKDVVDYSETKAMFKAYDMIHRKSFLSHYYYMNLNQKHFIDSPIYTKDDIIHSFHDSEYLPILEFIENESDYKYIYESFDKYSKIFKLNSIVNNESGAYIFIRNAGSLSYNRIDNVQYTFKVNREVVKADYMLQQWNSMIVGLGYDENNYLSEYILYNDHHSFEIAVSATNVSCESFEDCSNSDKNLLIQYIIDNYSLLYKQGYVNYIDYFISQFVIHLENLSPEDIITETLVYDINVYKIGDRYNSPDKFDLFIWAINPHEIYKFCDEENIPYLVV